MLKVSSFPKMIIFDILNVCNLRCYHCPQKEIKKRDNYRAQFLDFKLFKKIIDEISNHKVNLVRFTGDGEPLLYKNILEMITYAKSKVKGKINLTTNGILLNENIARYLLRLPIDFIDISIDAFTENKYNQIRQGGDFKRLINNVQRLVSLKSELNSPAKIVVNMINQKLVKNEIDKFKNYWTPLVDFVLIRNLHTVNNYLVAENKNKVVEDRYPCPHLYKRITIDFAGNVKFCAHDWFDNSIIGNLKNTTIKEVWNGAQYGRLRFCHEQNKFEEVPLCRNCQDWKSVPWDYGYDKVIKNLNKNNKKQK